MADICHTRCPLYAVHVIWHPGGERSGSHRVKPVAQPKHLGIDVKAAERYNTTMLKGLRALAELPGLRRRVLAYRGQRSFRTDDGIDVWTMPQLHHALATDELWP